VSIGSELTAARERVDMTIEQLSAATRIRTGLLVAMEADDFSRCGGNFYARGHIRAIARVVKADPAPLLAIFDAEHAVDEDKSRRDDRATVKGPTPSLRPARPRWGLVLGAILVALMGWGMVRLFTLPNDIEANASKTASTTPAVTTPVPKATPQPTAGPTRSPSKPLVLKTELTLTAKGDGTYLTVRDRKGKRLFQGHLSPGIAQSVTSVGDIRVYAGNPANLIVTLNGKRHTTKLYRFTAHPDGTLTKSTGTTTATNS
jgi:cytoskeleton protein RodZ